MSEITVKRGKIESLAASWGSGIAFLNFQDGSSVPADNAPLVRALRNAGAAEIAPGHTARVIEGFDLVYWLDDFGLTLGGFVPYDAWLEKGLPALVVGVETVVDLDAVTA